VYENAKNEVINIILYIFSWMWLCLRKLIKVIKLVLMVVNMYQLVNIMLQKVKNKEVEVVINSNKKYMII
jgi:hypothetical protein